MTSSADPDQLTSELIWIFIVCKDRAYLGSAGPGLTSCQLILCHLPEEGGKDLPGEGRKDLQVEGRKNLPRGREKM